MKAKIQHHCEDAHMHTFNLTLTPEDNREKEMLALFTHLDKPGNAHNKRMSFVFDDDQTAMKFQCCSCPNGSTEGETGGPLTDTANAVRELVDDIFGLAKPPSKREAGILVMEIPLDADITETAGRIAKEMAAAKAQATDNTGDSNKGDGAE